MPAFDQLHNTRKLIKEVIYMTTFLEGNKSKLIQRLRSLEARAGQYHDKQVLINLLEETEMVEKTQIHFLESECERDEIEITELARKIYK